MAKKYENRDDGWRISDEMWNAMEKLLPPPKPHPLGCHRPRLNNRLVLDMIFLVLRTGMQWNALNATGICSCTPVYQRFREWADAGVFTEFWRQGLLEYDRLKGIDWEWLALDGAMTKAPLGGEKNRPQPNRPRQKWRQAQPADRGERDADRPRDRWREPARHETGGADAQSDHA